MLLAKKYRPLTYIYNDYNNSNFLTMYTLTESTLSERPAYDAKMIDFVLSTYCTVEAIKKVVKVTKKHIGIDVAKRKDAILNSLAATKPLQIFGEVELDVFKHSR